MPRFPRTRARLHFLSIAPFLLLFAACGGSGGIGPNLYRERPDFLVGEPARTDYDGVSTGLLTGSTPSLSGLLAFKLPVSPNSAEVRTLAIYCVKELARAVRAVGRSASICD